ncbi:MAG: hypothetical protein CVV64_20470 [Candidatus Wallbacteria bacterium HGW-Wallbacteria-1]|jgi:hypothetical protein|uniref:Uncharacterized protein n=1 Tax=Candidatus Wallbacteria bacterium HGW-Wallbacteria-1 TaxID=2013854 RepID=A0A2N1PI95_9BACT|nr:MAG: hypothetical protein CVV64_20470 [Candidatus Wallbacteria bacterium HGW-Wallbacteria-1]
MNDNGNIEGKAKEERNFNLILHTYFTVFNYLIFYFYFDCFGYYYARFGTSHGVITKFAIELSRICKNSLVFNIPILVLLLYCDSKIFAALSNRYGSKAGKAWTFIVIVFLTVILSLYLMGVAIPFLKITMTEK